MYDFTLTGRLNGNVETIYNAFNEPNVIVKWFAPGDLIVSQFISHFIVGGQYRAVFQCPNGFQQTVVGTYQEIQRNNQLSFTWRWDDTNDTTKVKVVFTPMPNSSTRIILTQSGFHKKQDMLNQQSGWLACLEKLSLTTWEASATLQPLVA